VAAWAREVRLLVLAAVAGGPRREVLPACCVASSIEDKKRYGRLLVDCSHGRPR
jgi:hypothetical protein